MPDGWPCEYSFAENHVGRSLALVLGIIALFITPIVATLLFFFFGIMPSGRMFGGRAASKLRASTSSLKFPNHFKIVL